MIFGLIAAALNGCMLPIFTIVMGGVSNKLVEP